MCGFAGEIVIPPVASEKPEVDYEGELAVIIGRPCKVHCCLLLPLIILKVGGQCTLHRPSAETMLL